MATRMASSTVAAASCGGAHTAHTAHSLLPHAASAAAGQLVQPHQHQHRGKASSPASAASARAHQVPNRFTVAFAEMKRVCPASISSYAACVLEAEGSSSAIERGSCSEEFRRVKDCFRKVRGF
ncbi:unnamed protein product [Pseudo-nitzschia multistriata]|uniref:Uncharacterized protein n=1 Tax=Pseudo-nitzschia multistriata TaxID=183589 RepID=A0A448Z3M5_9STRA|nr:unnamed protein product [Pseudo-nitzschia multistriata]